VKDRYRHRTRHPQVSLDAEVETTGESFRDNLQEPKPTPGDSLQATERAEAVRKAVAQLPEELRVPVILFEYRGSVARGDRRDFEMLGQGCRDAPLPCATSTAHPAWLADVRALF